MKLSRYCHHSRENVNQRGVEACTKNLCDRTMDNEQCHGCLHADEITIHYLREEQDRRRDT